VFHSNSETETLALYLFVALLASCLLALGLLMMKSRAYRLPVAQGAGTLRSIAAWIRDPIWSAGAIDSNSNAVRVRGSPRGAPKDAPLVGIPMHAGYLQLIETTNEFARTKF
jgi:hypothetical protein